MLLASGNDYSVWTWMGYTKDEPTVGVAQAREA